MRIEGAMAGPREPSMEDILASIKRVIAEEKEIRAAAPPPEGEPAEPEEEDILELDETMAAPSAPPVDLGPPLLEEEVADSSRQKLEALASVAATAPPPPQFNPLEEMIREMLRPILKQWLDDHLPGIVDEHVKREIQRITGLPV
jgi:cell pole-organizing protein PopZ